MILNRKAMWAIGVVVLVTAAFGAFKLFHASSISTINGVTIDDNKPWVEVNAAKLVLLKESDGSVIKELHTGDQIDSGAVLQTDALGKANIYFPDGSVARLDAGTKLIIKDASFSANTGSIIVHLKLLAGRVWSKVFELATPDSTWEVQTPNSVATVRGTAFGMSYTKGKSSLFVSEHKVAMAALDTTSETKIAHLETEVGEGQALDMADQDIKVMKQKVADAESKNNTAAGASKGGGTVDVDALVAADFKTRVKEADTTWKDMWVKDAQQEDGHVNQEIDTIKKNTLETPKVRTEFRTIIRSNLEKVIEKRAEEQKNNDIKTDNTPSSDTKSGPSNEGSNLSSGGGGNAARLPVAKKLVIRSKGDLKGIIEGETISFIAVVTFDDGTSKDVTNDAEWKVVGSIGTFSKGIFTAKLDASVSEFGVGSGAIIASWKEESTGRLLFDKTDLFEVQAKVDPTTSTDG